MCLISFFTSSVFMPERARTVLKRQAETTFESRPAVGGLPQSGTDFGRVSCMAGNLISNVFGSTSADCDLVWEQPRIVGVSRIPACVAVSKSS
jgi:hypothetical protein